MKVRADFLVILAVAAGLHVLALVFIPRAPTADAAGTAGGGMQAAAMTDDLAGLVEAWQAEPKVDAPMQQAVVDTVEDGAEPPDMLAAVDPAEALDQPAETTLQPDALPKAAMPSPPTPAQPSPQPVESSPQTAALPQVQSGADQPTDATVPTLPIVPDAPNAVQVQTREDEAEPDPNKAAPTPRDLAVEIPAPDLQQPTPTTDAPPQIAALDRPEVTAVPDQTPFEIPKEVVPEDTGPAPRVARLPTAKPALPDWVIAEQRAAEARRRQRAERQRQEKQRKQQQRQQQRQAKKKPAEKAPAKPRQQQAAAPAAAPASQPPKGNTAAKPATAGSGNDQQRAALGTGQGQQGSGYSAAAVKSAKSAYIASVRRAILKKRKYPSRAKRRGITGRPVVRVTLAANGKLIGASLASSSGSDLLDNAAVAAVRSVGRYPRIPKEMARSKATLKFGINFQQD